MDDDSEVAVVGGGLAGLTAAARLAERGRDVTLFERRERVGGRVRSRTVDGFTLDRGFQVLFTAYPAVREELDLDALDLRRFAPGATICRDGSRAVLSDPIRDPRRAVESALNHEIPLTDKLRTLALRHDLLRRPEVEFFVGPDESIRAYLDDWGFSDAYVERFVEPFYGGITLDRSLSTSSQVFEYTFRAMSRGGIAVPAAGMAAVPDQLASRAREAGARIETGREVVRVNAEDGEESEDEGSADGADATVYFADDTGHAADAVVVATDPKTARRLTDVGSIPTEGVGCVSAWYTLPEGAPFETGGRILLNAGGDRPNTVIPMSEVAPTYAPDDRALINATFVDEAALDADDGTLHEATREALASWFPERSFGGLDPLAVDRIPFAQFAQPPGFRTDLPSVDDPEGPVCLAGDYTEWSSIQGAMASGQTASDAVAELLAE
ncbi:NAD(P)/FAD-dependent oxidoreductase [Haloparvum sedimenti]|uniref:NAD(P)/FAD-dependent oxidoreductase n=1 Tax=Haloparvum sedimenti TaxID=1678448 RepID=UPI00071E7EAA|nr:NAD(P)/FAD-dependent oxidoreductase [Haloparvum sedimenti]